MKKTSEKTSITVSIKDMILYLISRWRVLLICLLIGAVLGGAYSAYESMKGGAAAVDTRWAEAAYDDMSDLDKASAQESASAILHYFNQLEFYSAYAEKSVFQKLNPDAARACILTYAIENVKDSNFADSITSVYISNITDDRFAEEVAGAFGISAEDAFYYYDGIVRVPDIVKSDTNSKVDDEKATVVDTLKIIIYGEDDEFINKMADMVKTSVDRIESDISQKGIDHKITLLNETTKKNKGSYIYDRQEEYISDRKQVLQKLQSLKEDLDIDQVKIIEYLIREQYNGKYLDFFFDGDDVNDEDHSIHISKKWVLAGAAGLFVLAILVIVIKYLLMGVIRCYDDIEYIYGIQVLGTYDDPKILKKSHKLRLDKWIKSLRIKRKSQDRESSVALIAKKLELLSKNHSMSNICVAIGPDVDTDESFMAEVVEKAKNINVTVAENILRNADAINQILDADGVVLLEQMDKSRFMTIDEECCMCSGNNIKILGAIVAE